MYSLRKSERQLLLRNLKRFNIATTSIRNLELREEYKELTPTSSTSQIPRPSRRSLPYMPSPPYSIRQTPKSSSSIRKRSFLPS